MRFQQMLSSRVFVLLSSAVLWCCSICQAQNIKITAVGDIYLTANTLRQSSASFELDGDVIFGNFEGTIGSTGAKFPCLEMPAASVPFLAKCGFNVLSLANNHSLDLGQAAYKNTLKKLKSQGIVVVEGIDSGCRITIRGHSVRIVAFSFAMKNDVNKIKEAQSLIASLKEDIIIVSAHMGGESFGAYKMLDSCDSYFGEPRGCVKTFARACIDAGADLVLGHGPHSLRGLELYKNRLIVYSLGNFIFDYPASRGKFISPSIVLSIKLSPQGEFVEAKIHSYLIHNGRPIKDPYNRASRLVANLSANKDVEQFNFVNDTLITIKGKGVQ